MSILRSLVSGARALFGREQRNQEIDEELQWYFHAAVEEKMRRGMDRENAERAARVEVGSAAVVAEDLPVLHLGQRMLDTSADLAVRGVEFLLPVRQVATVTRLAVRHVTPGLPW